MLDRHRGLALWLVSLALLIKALVPAGYMIGPSHSRTFDVIVCADGMGAPIARQIAIEFDDSGKQAGKHVGGGECAFTALGHGSIAVADPALLVLALLFILLLGSTARPSARAARAPRLRPPLRGPPARA
ncbi:DUF2946 family protein [Sphingopyxis sp. R3-92]|uniref:DUF2946 family protein n=1 Tax=Sphingopyxis sp. R3-92 TaxID=3158553 RepID=UPI003EE7845A